MLWTPSAVLLVSWSTQHNQAMHLYTTKPDVSHSISCAACTGACSTTKPCTCTLPNLMSPIASAVLLVPELAAQPSHAHVHNQIRCLTIAWPGCLCILTSNLRYWQQCLCPVKCDGSCVCLVEWVSASWPRICIVGRSERAQETVMAVVTCLAAWEAELFTGGGSMHGAPVNYYHEC